MTPVGVVIAGNDPMLAGYDMDYSKLIFERMLGLNVTYIASGTFTDMYRSLRSGACDVAISAAEMCALPRRMSACWRCHRV